MASFMRFSSRSALALASANENWAFSNRSAPEIPARARACNSCLASSSMDTSSGDSSSDAIF
eukprot:5699326-Lingulodinium_polyedra.AAC.1